MTALGNNISSSTATLVIGAAPETYAGFTGTAMAAPHASGALAILMKRFGYMNNEQALSVRKTTAVQHGTVNNPAGVAVANPNASKMVEVPYDRNGWGPVSLRNATRRTAQASSPAVSRSTPKARTMSGRTASPTPRSARVKARI